MIRIAICDDDLIIASSIENLLLKISEENHIKINIEVFSDGSELWKAVVAGYDFDLLYLDIEMERLNGIDVAKRIREKNFDVFFIYISSYDNYFRKLLDVEPFRFLDKPIDEELFKQYFKMACERILTKDTYFEYCFNKITHKVCVKDIMYFESVGRTIVVKHKDGIGKFYGKLNQIEKEMMQNETAFLRIHQSYLINYHYITEMSFSKVTMIDGTVLRVSEDRQKMVRKLYNELLGGEYFDR